MKGRSVEGMCLLCGAHGPLSFEHVPPESAFNDEPIFIQNHNHLSDTQSNVYGKRMRSNRGFGGHTLCETCNNNTGAWYGKGFVEFARQGMSFLKSNGYLGYVQGDYRIKPLNVIKQIMTMFMSADKSGYLQSKKDIIDYLLNKESTAFPKDFKVFIYSNASPHKRLLGYGVVYDPILGIQKWSEINFEPFGYLLADKSGPAHPNMVDISLFGTLPYDEVRIVALTTVYLKVSSPIIGMYD